MKKYCHSVQREESPLVSRHMPSIIVFLSMMCILSTPSFPQSTRFKLALPGYNFQFPRDHAAHPDYRTEWWYFTGNVKSEQVHRYGYELTIFRHRIDDSTETFEANPSRWAEGNFYFAHFAISDIDRNQFIYKSKHARPAVGLAGASATECRAWVHDWSILLKEDAFHLHAGGKDYGIDLQLSPEKPHVIHGIDGVSQKSDGRGQASHYISFTRLRTTGHITVKGKSEVVTGFSWSDHEFGSNQLGSDQAGWDWYCIQLDNNTEIMLYNMRKKDGSRDLHSSGTWIAPDGSASHLTDSQWSVTFDSTWTSPHTGAVYPMGWTVQIPEKQLTLRLRPLMKDQELSSAGYWEGAIEAEGEQNGIKVNGQGYIELVGYTGSIVGL